MWNTFDDFLVIHFLNELFQIQELKDIRWHFIGHLQSNKCNNIVGKDRKYIYFYLLFQDAVLITIVT